LAAWLASLRGDGVCTEKSLGQAHFAPREEVLAGALGIEPELRLEKELILEDEFVVVLPHEAVVWV
jgi:hypothetical protein